jgi:hypothetical protein
MPSIARSTADARRQASLARRQLARVSVTLPELEEVAEPAALRQADLGAAAERAKEDLSRAAQGSAQRAQHARRFLGEQGLPVPDLPAMGTGSAGVQQALSGYQTLLSDNDALVNRALTDAQAAVSSDRGAVGTAQVLGMSQYLRAASAASRAERLRSLQAAKLEEALRLAAEWKRARAMVDQYRGLDVAEIVSDLEADEARLVAERDQLAAVLEVLEGNVTARRTALAELERRMADVQAQRNALENEGFEAGDDAAFDVYRTRYLSLSEELRFLQAQEQELRDGGRSGAELVGTDPTEAILEGGTPVVGLGELEWSLSLARHRLERLEAAIASIRTHAAQLATSEEQADGEVQRYVARQDELGEQIGALREAALALHQEAMGAERQAMRDAQSAATSFAQAKSATDAWARDAREIQQERDPQRKNLRLTAIINDPYLSQVAESAEAAARMLVARLQAQRADRTEKLAADLELLAQMLAEAPADVGELRALVETARTEGVQAAEQARAIYERLAGDSRASASAWVPQGAMAAAQHLAARLTPQQAPTLLSQAIEAIQSAVAQREQHPYLRGFVLFRDHLQGASTAPEGGQPEETDEDDFFLDEG